MGGAWDLQTAAKEGASSAFADAAEQMLGSLMHHGHAHQVAPNVSLPSRRLAAILPKETDSEGYSHSFASAGWAGLPWPLGLSAMVSHSPAV